MVLPMALTTTTTSSPWRRVRATWSATARIRSASPTEVPPNFWTTRDMAQNAIRVPGWTRSGPARADATTAPGMVSGRAQRQTSPQARRA